ILKLLTEERKIILKGPLTDLNSIAVRRDKLVEVLTNGKISLAEADLKAIRHEADRNQTLLKASLSGMQAAKTLLAEQHQAATTMGTYTDSGERLETPRQRDLKDRMV
ncbi:MAG: hypothetical protein ACTSRN_07600, partial [Alphaproteobacteria bacterium]